MFAGLKLHVHSWLATIESAVCTVYMYVQILQSPIKHTQTKFFYFAVLGSFVNIV